MKFYLILFIVLLHSHCFAAKYSGTVLCKETGAAVEYANIGIVGKNVGTTTDLNGAFTIDLDDVYDNEKIKLSCIGFEPLELKVADFKKAYKPGSIIYLKQQENQLKEVVFRPHKIRHKRLGNTANNKGMVAEFDTAKKGYEAGVLMEIRKEPTFIDSVQVNVCVCESDSIFLRLNIYEYIDTDMVNILQEPIYISMAASEFKDHKIKVDLSKKNLVANHNFVVSVEFIKDMGRHRMYFCASLSRNGYSRRTSQGNWVKVPLGAPAISAYVSY